jgi:hypothetical protein
VTRTQFVVMLDACTLTLSQNTTWKSYGGVTRQVNVCC